MKNVVRSVWRFLVSERFGFRRPSFVTPTDLALMREHDARMEQLELKYLERLRKLAAMDAKEHTDHD